MASKTVVPLLAPEDLASQLSVIEVLLSIYNGSAELNSGEGTEDSSEGDDVILSKEAFSAVRNLVEFLSLPLESLGKPHSVSLRDSLPAVIQMGLRLDPLRGTLDEDDEDRGKEKKVRRDLVLNIGFAIRRFQTANQTSSEIRSELKPRWNLQHPNWLERSAYDSLCQTAKAVEWEADESVGYVMNLTEAISEASLGYIKAAIAAKVDDPELKLKSAPVTTTSSIVLRTWHLFISLSMKEKRKDLVKYATRYGLTGFVLAGKPGFIVLESAMTHPEFSAEAAKQIDSFWSDIKTTSWSDLPAAHKKVSEKLREEGVRRCFSEMQEVTGIKELGGIDIEEGGRVGRNDLDKVKVWLTDRGCVGQLEAVLGKE